MSRLYARVEMASDVVVGEHCVFGYPKEARIQAYRQRAGSVTVGKATRIGAGSLIGNGVVLHEGVQVGEGAVLDDRVRVGYDSRIGAGCRVMYGAFVCDRVRLGAEARVAGFVCDAAVIGQQATVLGSLVHELSHPHLDWWGPEEPAPVVGDRSVVADGARVIGGVHIGPDCYVAAGAVVTKNVPAHSIVTATNVITPARQWSGTRLADWVAQHDSAEDGR